MPEIVRKMGVIIAGEFYDAAPDFVLTMETKGIPAALMAAQALGVPLVIARRSSKVYEGSAVNINYVSGSSAHIETMSLSRRAVREGQRALIVDDFLKAGGTARGMIELMGEFNVEVVGMAFVMAKAQPASKLIQGERALMVMDLEGEDKSVTFLYPSDWILLSRENIDTMIDAAATVEEVAELAQTARTQIEQLGIIVLMAATGANNINFQHQNAGVALSGDDLMNLSSSLQSNISSAIGGVSFYDPELMAIGGTDAMLLQYVYTMAGIDFTGMQVYMPVGTELAICTLTSSAEDISAGAEAVGIIMGSLELQ